MTPPARLLTIPEICQRLGGVSEKTAKRRIKDAGIRPARPGRAPMLTEDELSQVIEASRRRSPPPPEPPSEEARSARDALRSIRARQTKRLANELRGTPTTYAARTKKPRYLS